MSAASWPSSATPPAPKSPPGRCATPPSNHLAELSNGLPCLCLVVIALDVERHDIGVGAGDRTAAARRLPVGLLAEQRLTEPVELGDDLLRCRGHRLAGPFAQLLQLAGDLTLDVGGDLVLRQVLQLPLCLAYRGTKILGGGVRFADHLAAFTGRRFQSVEFAHGSLLTHRLGQITPVSADHRFDRNAAPAPNGPRAWPGLRC